jgi:hypothetical protein
MTADTSRYPNGPELRAWANDRQPGLIAAAGQLPRFLILAWNKAHPDRPYVPSQAHHGTPHGYSNKGCRCDRCLDAGRRYGREMGRIRSDDVCDAAADAFLESSS